jgi:hypothetical protein
MAEFTCRRCGATSTRPLQECDKDPESYGYLHRLEAPQGWEDVDGIGLLCKDCMAALMNFLQMKET